MTDAYSTPDGVAPSAASAETLIAAREAILAAVAQADGNAGYQAARTVLADLDSRTLLSVAATLAALAGRTEILLTRDEWIVLAEWWHRADPEGEPQ